MIKHTLPQSYDRKLRQKCKKPARKKCITGGYMEESMVEQSSSALETTPPVNFWHTFHLFPSSFDESCFKYWYIYIYGLLALALIPLLASYFNVVVPPSKYKFYTENTLLIILLPITLSLVVLSYNYWRGGIRGVFEDFDSSASGRHLSSRRGESHFSEEYRSFLNAYQDKLLSSHRYIIIGIAIIASAGILSLLLRAYISSPYLLLLFCILPGGIILGYFLGVSSWTMLVTGFYLRAVTNRFDLHIEPGRPDNCGGLKRHAPAGAPLRMKKSRIEGATFWREDDQRYTRANVCLKLCSGVWTNHSLLPPLLQQW